LSDHGALRTDAHPAQVGKAALAAGIALTELRAAEGARVRGDVPRTHRRQPAGRSSGMTAIAAGTVLPARATPACHSPDASHTGRAAQDVRHPFGFWLIASIVITALLATAGVVLFAPDSDLTYATPVSAIKFPIAVILPMIAILSVTSEWTQRSGLTTFTLIPHRNRVITARGLSSP
jgi:hypothetical protein